MCQETSSEHNSPSDPRSGCGCHHVATRRPTWPRLVNIAYITPGLGPATGVVHCTVSTLPHSPHCTRCPLSRVIGHLAVSQRRLRLTLLRVDTPANPLVHIIIRQALLAGDLRVRQTIRKREREGARASAGGRIPICRTAKPYSN